jgi:hypothetical protein
VLRGVSRARSPHPFLRAARLRIATNMCGRSERMRFPASRRRARGTTADRCATESRCESAVRKTKVGAEKKVLERGQAWSRQVTNRLSSRARILLVAEPLQEAGLSTVECPRHSSPQNQRHHGVRISRFRCDPSGNETRPISTVRSTTQAAAASASEASGIAGVWVDRVPFITRGFSCSEIPTRDSP